MKIALGAVVLAGTLAAFAAPAGSQECCDQGKPKPWKAYNTSVRCQRRSPCSSMAWARSSMARRTRSMVLIG
ncbi:MAG: hypothetical protein ACK44W_08725, partial [Planctomycetota bacterium]